MGDDQHLDVWRNYADDVHPVGPVDQHDPDYNLSFDDYPDHDDPEAQAAAPEEEEAQAKTEAVPAV